MANRNWGVSKERVTIAWPTSAAANDSVMRPASPQASGRGVGTVGAVDQGLPNQVPESVDRSEGAVPICMMKFWELDNMCNPGRV